MRGRFGLLSITKLQNLKAIHNEITPARKRGYVVINHKTTKFESNSQQNARTWSRRGSCYQSQNYKIWKQFTTQSSLLNLRLLLLSITKLQNLKAIHNISLSEVIYRGVVINHKTTKFESNSQQDNDAYSALISCYQSQNYKIWKQFTTDFGVERLCLSLLSITKLQNLKAIHNRAVYIVVFFTVVINHKTTKFESNSQLTL